MIIRGNDSGKDRVVLWLRDVEVEKAAKNQVGDLVCFEGHILNYSIKAEKKSKFLILGINDGVLLEALSPRMGYRKIYPVGANSDGINYIKEVPVQRPVMDGGV
jgi:hypothetical protein